MTLSLIHTAPVLVLAAKLVRLTTAAVLVTLAGGAQAQYPDRPVKVIVGLAAGGSADAIQRLFAQKLSERTGKPFIVERAGASPTTRSPRAVPTATRWWAPTRAIL